MSRVGKHAIGIPAKVQVSIVAGAIKVEGPKGVLSRALHPEIEVVCEDGSVCVKPLNDGKVARSMWGTTTRNIKQMVEGVTAGFKKVLDIEGVGFKAAMLPNSKMLRLSLGFSHDIVYVPCDGIEINCPTANKIEIVGISCEDVGQAAAEIRAFKKPEPFKGKGIRYSYPKPEQVRRKQGKKK
jgi:large subunit ribosomal protein L6